MNLQTVIQETAAAIDHQYQAGVCVGGSDYIRALELEAQLFEFAEKVADGFGCYTPLAEFLLLRKSA